MPPARRRSRTGIPLAVVIAVVTAIVPALGGRSATPAGLPLLAPAFSALPAPAFSALNEDGTTHAFFEPNDGEAYFRRQAVRVPGGGP